MHQAQGTAVSQTWSMTWAFSQTTASAVKHDAFASSATTPIGLGGRHLLALLEKFQTDPALGSTCFGRVACVVRMNDGEIEAKLDEEQVSKTGTHHHPSLMFQATTSPANESLSDRRR